MEATLTNRLEQEFVEFDEQNPGVWELFQRFTFELISFGYRHHSADAVMHRVRWESSIQTSSEDEFKINNNHVAFYARKFHDEYPIFRDFFRVRKQKRSGTAYAGHGRPFGDYHE